MKRFLDSADYADGQHICIGYALAYSLTYQNNLRLLAGFEEHNTKVDAQKKVHPHVQSLSTYTRNDM